MRNPAHRLTTLAAVLVCITTGRAAAQIEPMGIEPCCSVAGIDAARGVVTVKDKSGRFTFLLTLTNARAAAGLRVGQSVGFSNVTKRLFPAEPAGQPAQQIALSQIQFGGFNAQGPSGALGSAASSSGNGTFENPKDGKCGKVGTIIETPTKQCVVTSSSGAGCHFCVPIKK